MSDSSPATVPAILLPKDVAARLNITIVMLRKLTDRGAIGHVRIGAGEKRVRVGYTEAQVQAFIVSRTVPPASRTPREASRSGRRQAPRAHKAAEVAAGLVEAAISSGRVTEWRA